MVGSLRGAKGLLSGKALREFHEKMFGLVRGSLDKLCWKTYGLLKGPLFIGVEILWAVVPNPWGPRDSDGYRML